MATTEEEYPDDLNPFGDEEESSSLTPLPQPIKTSSKETKVGNAASLAVSPHQEAPPKPPRSPSSPAKVAKSARGTVLKADTPVITVVPPVEAVEEERMKQETAVVVQDAERKNSIGEN
jgi:hypothetical protein